MGSWEVGRVRKEIENPRERYPRKAARLREKKLKICNNGI